MSYKIKLGTFNKYVESTKQPNVTSWAEYDVVFKDGTDIVNPTITLSIDLTTVSAYNYAYMLNRYYWITSKTMIRTGYCTLTLKSDVLATYKNEIGSTSLYILRSSTSSNGDITDNYYPATGDITYNTQIKQPFGPSTYSGGFFVVNVMGTASAGASTLWKMSPSRFRSFINQLYTNLDGYTPADAAEAIKKLIQGQPEKLVSSATWFPDGVTFSTGGAENVVVANWNSGVNGNLISDVMASKTVTFTIPKHPQAATRGNYLNLSPYSNYTLTIPMIGSIALDSSLLIDATELKIDFSVDAISGSCIAEVYVTVGTETPILAELNGQIGVTMPLAGQSSGAKIVGGAASTAATAAAAIATGGASAIAGAVASGIGTAVGAITGTVSSAGSSGNAIASTRVWTLQSSHLKVVDEDNTHNGRPLCELQTPLSLGGFMIASRGDVDIPGTLPEEEEIRRFLENGFYYE